MILNERENGLVEEELVSGAAAWLSDLDRDKWPLEMAREKDGVSVPIFPDIVVVRARRPGPRLRHP